MESRQEYNSPERLCFEQSMFLKVPCSITMDADATEKRLTVYSFLAVKKAMDNSITFSLGGLLDWLGKKHDWRKGGLDDKLADAVKYVVNAGFVSLEKDFDKGEYISGLFNLDKVNQECSNSRFAIIYLDELLKIVRCKSKTYSNMDVVLLVFAYLRTFIIKRGELSTIEGSPEVYDCHLRDIAKDVGLSVRRVAQAVKVLEELGLVYSEELPRIKANGKWITNATMFCNMYKRENGCLVASGKEYYEKEIESKKRKLKIVKER